MCQAPCWYFTFIFSSQFLSNPSRSVPSWCELVCRLFLFLSFFFLPEQSCESPGYGCFDGREGKSVLEYEQHSVQGRQVWGGGKEKIGQRFLAPYVGAGKAGRKEEGEVSSHLWPEARIPWSSVLGAGRALNFPLHLYHSSQSLLALKDMGTLISSWSLTFPSYTSGPACIPVRASLPASPEIYQV